MPTNRIPERQPIGDHFTGALVQVTGVPQPHNHLLVATPPDGASVIAQGDFVVRYGIRYLGKPFLSIVPGLVALDYGDMLTGEDAWDFLLHKSNRFPRADVVGYRNDGEDEMIAVKFLDLALPVEVLVYRDAAATKPLAAVTALIAPASVEIPARLAEYLPRYNTFDARRSALAADTESNDEERTNDE
jgi:hypothetical protein